MRGWPITRRLRAHSRHQPLLPRAPAYQHAADAWGEAWTDRAGQATMFPD
jgi:hypothetical protein